MTRAADNVVMRDEGVTWVRFTVPGEAAAQGSKRHVGGGKMIEMSKRLPTWREDVRRAILDLGLEEPMYGPIEVQLLFTLKRPLAHFGSGRNANVLKDGAPDYAPKGRDIDKLCRAVLDAMEQASLIINDAQVAVLSAQKRYGVKPGLQATVRQLP